MHTFNYIRLLTQIGKWETVASMNESREKHAATSYKDSIFVSGGSNSVLSVLASAECYESRANRWRSINPMAQAR